MKAVMFPGQGSQYKGMGKELFKIYRKETDIASQILGYNIEELCVSDPQKELSKTQFTQPALYVVNTFAYNHQNNHKPDFFIGHSLGEYNALHFGGAFDFETGLKLVKKRGELMANAGGGGMAAVIGINAEDLQIELIKGNHNTIDIANYNTPHQTVIAGPQQTLDVLVREFDAKGIRIIPLAVSAPFHSSYMKQAEDEFHDFLKKFSFQSLQIPVISNVTGESYQDNKIHYLLSKQIASPVQWIKTIHYLLQNEVIEFEEVGGVILSKMVKEIREKAPIFVPLQTKLTENTTLDTIGETTTIADEQYTGETSNKVFSGKSLGDKAFRDRYNIEYSYYSGSMYRGIASKNLVIKMAKANMLGFLGTGGMSISEIEQNIIFIQNQLQGKGSYGMNLLHNLSDSSVEMKTVQLYLKHNIKNIEAAAFMQITEALVYFRLTGLHKTVSGEIIYKHNIIAKVSRPEVAELFMRPAPEKIVKRLLEDKYITEDQATLSRHIPMSFDICVEADSGGHTDAGVALVLLPAIQRLRDRIQLENNYSHKIRVGLAGGIGTPQSVACAFVMGADFVATGSINQCTVEAGMSDIVKDLLQEINVQDTEYAPAGDMFELGAKVQVLKKGVLFAARANKLYTLYQQYDSISHIPENIILQLEKNYFKKPISVVWEETKDYLRNNGENGLVEKIEQNPKEKMAMIFRWYFGYSNNAALNGLESEKMNFQIHTGPALGAFNQWAKGTNLESWRNRHVDEIGKKMMEDAAILLKNTLQNLINS